jgi:peroxiredoxin
MNTPLIAKVRLTSPDLARRAAVLATLGTWALFSGCARDVPAPVFDYTLLDGSRHSSAALRGQVLLLNFWATSCAVCVKEMPQLAATHRQFASQGLQTLAVAMQYDAPALVADFTEKRQLPFGVVIDNTGAVARAFGDVTATPTTLLVNRAGRIVWRHEGEPSFPRLQARIAQLLAETA